MSNIKSIVIFGGTTEGRRLAEAFAGEKIQLHICVATEYGASLIAKAENIHVRCGRMDVNDIQQFLIDTAASLCVDATHPYAELVTENVRSACKQNNTPYVRIEREEASITKDGEIVYVDSVEKAVEYLATTEGKIFITTGSKELDKYTVITDYKDRCVARVLSTAEVINNCASLGFEGKNLFAMQGPFSEELNYQMFIQTKAKWLVTKSSGREGGYPEKCEAAIRAGLGIVVVGRPPEDNTDKKTVKECIAYIEKSFDTSDREEVSRIYVVGMGPGAESALSLKAKEILDDCELIIGADRIVKIYSGYKDKECYVNYNAYEIAEYINAHKEFKSIAVVYSGDIGYYSGAKKFLQIMEEYKVSGDYENVLCKLKNGSTYELIIEPGFSSVVYFMDILAKSWDDTIFTSNHGRSMSLLPLIRDNHKVCTLIGKQDDIASICTELVSYGMGDVKVTIGMRLSYPDQRIVSNIASELTDITTDTLSVVLFENENACRKRVTAGIKDEDFIRGKVPITKEEVRTVSLSKLALSKDSIVFDIGAGTGSVSVEAAMLCPGGQVYAIERNQEAINLIKENQIKHRVSNINVIEGSALEVIGDLPTPTHAFIGGSGGDMSGIIAELIKKNPDIRCVINAVTIETVSEIKDLIGKFSQCENMELIQLGVSRARKLGGYHLMDASNPVYIACFGRGI